MAQTTLTASADTRLQALQPTSAYGLETYLQVGEYNAGVGYVVRTLIKFDLSSIPTSATIVSATLRMYDSGANYSDNTRTMYANRSKRAWVESQATWNVYSTGNSWSTAGGATNSSDVELSAIGSVSMPATEVAGYVEISLTASAIQEWLTGTFTNNGLMISMGTELNDMHDFNSREGSNPPQLVITYSLGSALMSFMV